MNCTAAPSNASTSPGTTASAASASSTAGTNMTAGVRSGGASSSDRVSSSVASGGPPSPRPRKIAPPARSAAPAVSADVAISTAVAQPYPSLDKPSSSSDFAKKLPNGGSAANDSAPSAHTTPVSGSPRPKDRRRRSDT